MNRNKNLGKVLMKRLGVATTARGAKAPEKPAPDLFRLADLAREAREWTADTYYRRHICQMEPDRAGHWTQYGHALKEAGFHGRAESAYQTALALIPDDADLHLQLGHLAKVRGDFNSARAWFVQARDLGHPEDGEIDHQLDLLTRIDNTSVFQELDQSAEKSGVKIYLSVAGSRSGLTAADTASILGRKDYSYAFAMRGFVEALDQLEIDHELIQNPEFVADIRDRSSARHNIHLGFYPPDRVRVLKGAYNINCFAWEFDRLRSPAENTSHHAFADQATMLEIVDELWVPSTHGAAAVRGSVSKPVEMVPAPVVSNLARRPRSARPEMRELNRLARALSKVQWQPLAVLPRIQDQMDQGSRARQASLQTILARSTARPRLYLSVFNVHDFRKQIEPMLNGFLAFAEGNPDATLLLKLTSPYRGSESANAFLMKEQIFNAGRLIPPMVSDRIWLTDAVLSGAELNALYDISSHYLCTSYAEGQNLPLIEAMGRGVVPVSVDHTAMADYVTEANAIPIRSQVRPLDVRMATRYGLFGVESNFVGAADVQDSLVRAAGLSAEAYAALSAAALETVCSTFGVAAFRDRLNALLERLSAGEHSS